MNGSLWHSVRILGIGRFSVFSSNVWHPQCELSKGDTYGSPSNFRRLLTMWFENIIDHRVSCNAKVLVDKTEYIIVMYSSNWFLSLSSNQLPLLSWLLSPALEAKKTANCNRLVRIGNKSLMRVNRATFTAKSSLPKRLLILLVVPESEFIAHFKS